MSAPIGSTKARLAFFGAANVVMGALAMAATMPGRTHGLGLITEPLIKDFDLTPTNFATINLWATLLGAVGCLQIGRLIDRFGTRSMAVLVSAALGLTVIGMSQVTNYWALFTCVLLTRAIGQSALSVVSISIVGKWFSNRAKFAMAVYAVLIGVFFGLAFDLVGRALKANWGWRDAWTALGIALVAVCAPLFAIFVRGGANQSIADAESVNAGADDSYDLWQALRTPAFWAFAGSTALYGLVTSGSSLFNEAILRERGFDADVFYDVTKISFGFALIGQFLCGVLALFLSLPRLMAIAMTFYAGSLMFLPFVANMTDLWIYMSMMGTSGGIMMVIFFAIWGEAYGRAHLGRIQGAAQMMTVLASAVGPLLFAKCLEISGSFLAIFTPLAIIVLVAGLACAFISLPNRKKSPAEIAEVATVS